MDPVYWLYLAGCLLRVYYVLLPQTGYIHPDEFFQSTEIVAGDLLDVAVDRPWEFNETNPVRSIISPYIMAGLPFQALQMAGDGGRTQSAYLCLVGPRIQMLMYSFIIDICLWKISSMMGVDTMATLFCYCISYPTLTFLTRTFSNSLETVLFSMFIYITMKSVQNQCHANSQKTFSILFVWIGIVTSLGVFNRPTFLLFIITPILWWVSCFWRLLKFKIVYPVFQIVLAGISSSLLVIIIDSLYFNSNLSSCLLEQWQSYELIKWTSCGFVITPWNFFKYNSKTSNLQEHGLHTRYTHFLVNFLLLFGPFGLVFYAVLCSDMITVLKKRFMVSHQKPSPSRTEFPFKMTIIISMLLLSVFPHQEPRFLLPLAPLVIIVVSQYVKPFDIDSRRFEKVLLYSVLLFNIFMMEIYGFWHQGGVVQSLIKFRGNFTEHSPITNLVYYHTYSPPRHLLLDYNRDVYLHDLAGSNPQDIYKLISGLDRKDDIYVIVPAVLEATVQTSKYSLKVVDRISRHLTTEDLPTVDFRLLLQAHTLSEAYDVACELFQTVLFQMQLSVMKVTQH